MTALDRLRRDGWIVAPGVVDGGLVERLRGDLEHAYDVCRGIQLRNGVGENTDGTVHHVLGLGPSFMELLERQYLSGTMRDYFGAPYILNSFGGVLNSRERSSYVGQVHRDIRSYSDAAPLMINMLVMLDEFTPRNGATYVLTASHTVSEQPGNDDFFAKADRALGPAGSILLFNSCMWHAAGENTTDWPRRALTLTFTRPFMKQQLDYPRYLGYDYADRLSEEMRQLLGYNSRVPANHDEWYQPPERRFYKPGQG